MAAKSCLKMAPNLTGLLRSYRQPKLELLRQQAAPRCVLFGWSELTARINAARDLRRVLHRDSSYGSASFGDAAAAYFKPASNGKQPVNHGDLEHGKSNWRKAFSAEENAATGDRET